MRVGGGEEGREVLLRRDIKWGGIICAWLLEKDGGIKISIVLVEGLGSGQRRQACWD